MTVLARAPGDLAERLDAATAHLEPPLATLDLTAFWANALDLVRRAGGKAVRIASKSVRCRALLDEALTVPGLAGLMTYSLAEAVWLAEHGATDLLMGYPTANRHALRTLAEYPKMAEKITLMVDDVDQLRFAREAIGSARPSIRVCLDVDASLRIGRLHLGVRRSPVRTPEQAAALAFEAARLGFRVVGLMFYEAQIAGLPDSNPALRLVKRRSAAELAVRRGHVVTAVTAVTGQLELVNSGGTGSLEISAADPAVTEVTAGSGLYMPALFDAYRAFSARPAMYFALPVVRRPAPKIATLFGGGYAASGPAGKSRLPRPTLPSGLRLVGTEGAGEVQTPVQGATAANLHVGDRVWFRHAKAGEMLERFDAVHLVDGDRLVDSVPTYRGEDQNFG